MKPGCKLPLVLLAVAIGSGPPLTAWGDPADPAVLTAQIDRRIADQWTAAGVEPAPPADDAAFLRRVMLDLIGRIPTAAEARAFLEDKSADKCARLVAKLVSSAAHARHAAGFWRQQWVPQTDAPSFAILAEELDDWLAARLRAGAGYDDVVRDLMTASQPGSAPGQGTDQGTSRAANPRTDRRAASTAFLAASEHRPENLAANTARAFLGINLDCAQCHDHPFARWTRDQFWETAAFFARLPPGDAQPAALMIEIPDKKVSARARVLADPQPSWPETLHDDTGRSILAGWVTSRENPWFARNAVNRVWAALLGAGLVEPLDDLSGDNAASHPELLEDLAQAFRDSGYDLKFLTTAIVLSRAYQISSANLVHESAPEARLFSRFVIRPLSGEQLYDSLRIAAGLPPARGDLDSQLARDRLRFTERFRGAAGSSRSILQALSLMNGEVTAQLTQPESSPTLQAIATAPFLDADGKITTLFLAALGRRPTDAERLKLAAYLAAAGDAAAPSTLAPSTLADLLWALLNSSEFSTNH